MGKLKIGFVLDDTLDTPDGVQQYVLTLGNWMIEQGHTVHYLVGHTQRQDIANVHSLSKNVRVKFNGNSMSTPLPASKRKIAQLLAREQFDVLHVQIPYSPLMAGRVIAAAPKHTAILGTFHIAPNSSFVTMGNTLLGKLLASSLKRFDIILSVSHAAADFAKKTYAIESNVLPNVVKASHFRNADPVLDDGIPTIVFLGRLVPRKGCQILLQAVHILHKQMPEMAMRVVICGRGELEAELKKYTQEHNLDSIVQFAGFVDDIQKARYLKSADIAVFPSTGGESFGIVLLEAMAADRPIVLGADNDGYKTVLGPYPDALFPSNNSVALAKKIHEVLENATARKQALSWQKAYIRQFDVAVVGSRLIARYHEALRFRRSS